MGVISVINIMLILILGNVEWIAFLLGGITLGWMAMAAAWERAAKSSIKGHRTMIEEYGHLSEYVVHSNETMQKSLEALSTYDRDMAIEIAHEFNAFTKKSLYDFYWRENREESTTEHE